MSSNNPTMSTTELLAGMLTTLQAMQQNQLAMQETQLQISSQISELVNVQKRSDDRIANFIGAFAKSHNMMPPRSPGIHGLSPLTAGKRLTDTFELVEHILMLLDPRDVMLHGQRVNKTFRATVTNSAALQCKLFLKPDYSGSGLKLNPFLGMANLSHRLPVYYIHDLNTLAYTHKQRSCQVFLTDSREIHIHGSPHLSLEFSSGRTKTLANYAPLATGSWRSMYLTQPPCLIKAFVSIGDTWGRLEEKGGRVILRECTMDRLLEALAETTEGFGKGADDAYRVISEFVGNHKDCYGGSAPARSVCSARGFIIMG
ncbi:hypothetical protein LTR86_006083 [Recurvomyces mirabilis]|nr:hypothetical protein LTR86_006083 [Recurvomyces mirabilis]